MNPGDQCVAKVTAGSEKTKQNTAAEWRAAPQ